jgi:hypothetical protein
VTAVLPLHPRTARAWRRPAGSASSRRAPACGCAAARLPRVHVAARPRARRAHRLGRRAEGGLPRRRAVRDAARHDRVGRDGRRRAGTCSSTSTRRRARGAGRAAAAERPPLYGDGRAGARVVAALAGVPAAR